MTNAADIAIEAMLAARAEHRRVFSKGAAQAEWADVKKANDAIGTANELGWAALGISMQYIGNDALLEKLRNHPGAISK